ncbi:MAG: hypothetical protein V5A34_03125 [Halapricum sp.]
MKLSEFDQPAWRGVAGAVLGYALLLAIIFVTIFVIPYLLFVV